MHAPTRSFTGGRLDVAVVSHASDGNAMPGMSPGLHEYVCACIASIAPEVFKDLRN